MPISVVTVDLKRRLRKDIEVRTSIPLIASRVDNDVSQSKWSTTTCGAPGALTSSAGHPNLTTYALSWRKSASISYLTTYSAFASTTSDLQFRLLCKHHPVSSIRLCHHRHRHHHPHIQSKLIISVFNPSLLILIMLLSGLAYLCIEVISRIKALSPYYQHFYSLTKHDKRQESHSGW